MTDHPHKFVYQGVGYKDTDNCLAGSGARRRLYYNVYFCERCAETQFVKLSYEDHTYMDIKFNATPVPEGAQV